MKMAPTYTAEEIRTMCITTSMHPEAFKILAELINEEIELYNQEDLIIIIEASMILFTRSLLMGSIKFMK